VESSRLILRRIVRGAYAIALLLLVAAAPASPQSTQSLSAKLPLDPAIHAGKLPNGITYLLRHNDRPAKRVSLRMAVKAGSIDEADDQRGLAHMLEHMAFNGTTHFKPGELVAYFESIGVSFGAHVNAYTGYDETVYMLDVPTDRMGAIDHGLQAMADFRRRHEPHGRGNRQGARRRPRRMASAARRRSRGCRGSRTRPSTANRSMRSGCRSARRNRSEGAVSARARFLSRELHARSHRLRHRRRHRHRNGGDSSCAVLRRDPGAEIGEAARPIRCRRTKTRA
jgi:hypothetical protein